jgi:hypothetical protein
MAATVFPIRRSLRVVKSPPIMSPLCPVCGLGLTLWSGDAMDDSWSCNACGAEMHEECFWGRVATLDEWRDYLERWILSENCPGDPAPSLCPTCRAAKGA